MPDNGAVTESLRQLLCLLAKEHPVFQSHVLGTLQDAIESPATLAACKAQLHASFPEQTLAAFIAGLPPAQSPLPQAGPIHELLLLAEGSSVPPGDIATLITGELLHRKAWEEVLARYPGTLTALKERLAS